MRKVFTTTNSRFMLLQERMSSPWHLMQKKEEAKGLMGFAIHRTKL